MHTIIENGPFDFLKDQLIEVAFNNNLEIQEHLVFEVEIINEKFLGVL